MVSCVLTGTTREIVGHRIGVYCVCTRRDTWRPSMILVEGSIALTTQYKALQALAHPPHHIGDVRAAHLAALMKQGNLQKEEEALHAFRWAL